MRSGKRESRVNRGNQDGNNQHYSYIWRRVLRNQFSLLVLKLFCQQTDTVRHFSFLVYLVFFNIAFVVQPSNTGVHDCKNKDSCIGYAINTIVKLISFIRQSSLLILCWISYSCKATYSEWRNIKAGICSLLPVFKL